jgi:hypothetical protein
LIRTRLQPPNNAMRGRVDRTRIRLKTVLMG